MVTQRWFRRVLVVCPVLVTVLWVAGVAHFRQYWLQPREWLVLVAGAFALHAIAGRYRRPRPLPPLPPGTSPVRLAVLAAAIIGVLASLVGGLLEWLVEPYRPSETSWALRTTWHAACSFAASYCGFLLRLTEATAGPRRAAK